MLNMEIKRMLKRIPNEYLKMTMADFVQMAHSEFGNDCLEIIDLNGTRPPATQGTDKSGVAVRQPVPRKPDATPVSRQVQISNH